MEFSINKDDYYDLTQNRITIRGYRKTDSIEDAKTLSYPSILPNLYCITKTGQVYSTINDIYIAWAFKNNIPFVNLSCVIDGKWRLEPFYIKDLMACSYIANANSYLERGYHASNIDGDPRNCRYNNIVYIKS
jgi:hypothetical protein|nr:MAG TPA: hypothetical protein [Caudoviricetes sp.]